MASIKLKHASGNSTILNSPAANPTNDVTLKLPSTSGSAGQVLKVASANHSATNAELEFAGGGGITLLSTTTITNNSTSISISLSGYQHLVGTITNITAASNLGDCLLRFNSDSGTNYVFYVERQDGNESRSTYGDKDATAFYMNATGIAGLTSGDSIIRFTLFDVNSGLKKLFKMLTVGGDPNNSGNPFLVMTNGQYKGTSAITSLQLSGSTAFTGGEVKLYGVK